MHRTGARRGLGSDADELESVLGAVGAKLARRAARDLGLLQLLSDVAFRQAAATMAAGPEPASAEHSGAGAGAGGSNMSTPRSRGGSGGDVTPKQSCSAVLKWLQLVMKVRTVIRALLALHALLDVVLHLSARAHPSSPHTAHSQRSHASGDAALVQGCPENASLVRAMNVHWEAHLLLHSARLGGPAQWFMLLDPATPPEAGYQSEPPGVDAETDADAERRVGHCVGVCLRAIESGCIVRGSLPVLAGVCRRHAHAVCVEPNVQEGVLMFKELLKDSLARVQVLDIAASASSVMVSVVCSEATCPVTDSTRIMDAVDAVAAREDLSQRLNFVVDLCVLRPCVTVLCRSVCCCARADFALLVRSLQCTRTGVVSSSGAGSRSWCVRATLRS